MGDQKDLPEVADESIPNDVSQGDAETVPAEGGETESADEMSPEAIALRMSALMSHPLYALPKNVRRNIRALKNLELQHINLEVDFFKELHALEVKYERRFEPFYEKRRSIVTGAVVPTDEECEYHSDGEREMDLSCEIEKVKVAEEEVSGKTESEPDVKGVPEFWLTALKNAPSMAELIEECDEPILKHLIDLTVSTTVDPMTFTIGFHFEPNEYFTNEVLTKFYELKCVPDPTDPFNFEGPEIIKCKGCTIDWNKNKNVTVKTIKKRQKHKARGAVRTVTKVVNNESFFNFFSPPEIPDNPEEVDEEHQNVLNNDFEVGNMLKDRLIPHAVLFFTGENLLDDDFDEDEMEEEDEDEEDEEEDEEEDDEEEEDEEKAAPKPAANRKKGKGAGGAEKCAAPAECKQQ